MARPLRLEFAGAFYHVTSRGDHREDIFLTLDEYRALHPNKDESRAKAYQSGVYTMAEIGRFFGVHYMTVSRAVRKFEGKQGEMLEC